MPAPRRRHLRFLAALAALVLLGAACGDDDSTASDEPTVESDAGDDAATDDDEGEDSGSDEPADVSDPCTLLSAADLASTFGRTWDDGDLTEVAFQGQQCTWATSDEQLPVMQFYVAVYAESALEAETSMNAEEFFASTREFGTTVDEELDFGDESFRSGSTVWVRDGSTIYTLSTVLGDSAEAIAGLLDLTEQVVG